MSVGREWADNKEVIGSGQHKLAYIVLHKLEIFDDISFGHLNCVTDLHKKTTKKRAVARPLYHFFRRSLPLLYRH